MLSNLNSVQSFNSIQSTIQDLKEIVNKNQGVNHEASVVVRQMEQLVSDIEVKTRTNRKGSTDLPMPHPAAT